MIIKGFISIYKDYVGIIQGVQLRFRLSLRVRHTRALSA